MAEQIRVAQGGSYRRRVFRWSLALLVLATLALPVGGNVALMLRDSAVTHTAAAAAAPQETNPRANYWRAVRDGATGYTAVEGQSMDVLIQNGGENWRRLRNGPVATIGAWLLGATLVILVLFHFLIGPLRVEKPLSGDRMPRWSLGDRILHWYTATLFIVMAATGLSLLFGRAVLIPVLGLEAFGAYAAFAKWLHNYLGPFFVAGVLLEVLFWFSYNRFKRHDWPWLKRFGGVFGAHVPAGRTNAGEKIWFWFIATVGLIAVGISGLVMDFPIFGQTRETMQIANLIHASLAILWTAIALGHIYIGTLGTPGALDGMVKGHVAKEWMQTHHDLWYRELERQGKVIPASELKTPEARRKIRAGGAAGLEPTPRVE